MDKLSSKSASQISALGSVELHKVGQANPENRLVSLQNLVNLLPDLSNNVLNIYTRAANITEEALPQLLFSETVIRLARILSATQARDGILDDFALKHIVMNEPLEPVRHPERPRASVSLRKTEIAAFLFRAFPPPTSFDLPVTDSVPILVGIASVLSALGLDRKRAFVLRELLSILVFGLVQARKIGAAEIGIHPAAGLSALNNTAFDINALDIGPGNTEESTRTLLALAGRTYGAQRTTDDLPLAHDLQPPALGQSQIHRVDDTTDAIVDRAFRYSAISVYGDHSLKVDILKACINFCEALPDFQGVLQFTVDLLHTVKRTLMLFPGHNRTPTLPQEEQVRLLNNVKRTVGAAHKLGVSNLEADYWDDFLVRGVEIICASDYRNPIRRSKVDFGVSTAIERQGHGSPFIYNAFAKPIPRPAESLLIAKEETLFKITLQNPFEFEVEIESLRLVGEGVSFEACAHDLWLAPFSIQEKVMSGIAAAEGTLTIKECIVKVRFCRERCYPIFATTWVPEPEAKIKRMGLSAKEPSSDRPLSWSSSASGSGSGTIRRGPESETLLVNVIKTQPTLIVDSVSLSQSAVMMLEGEMRSFDITVRNISNCKVDTVFLTFEDSTTRQLEAALGNKDNLPTDVYELELQLVTNPALQWRRDDAVKKGLLIEPGETSTFTIDVFGKPGLQDATVYIDYAYTGAPFSEIPETFHTRQISFPLSVTVNASVDIARCDILPFSSAFTWSNWPQRGANPTNKYTSTPFSHSSPSRSSSQIKMSDYSPVLSQNGTNSNDCDHALLLLDVRSAWPTPLSISLSVAETPPTNGDLSEVVDELQPGHISRFILAVPQVFLDNPHKPIPVLNPGNKRQFVVSGNKLSYEAESTGREAFWYREELLKHLKATWKEDVSGRHGIIELRNIRLNPRMIDLLRIEDVDISFSINGRTNDSGDPVKRTGSSAFAVKTNSFLTLTTTIINRSSRAVHPLLRLQPNLRNQPHTVALDLSKRLSCTGILQRALPILEAGQTTQTSLGITALCRGEYEIGGSVEEIRLTKPPQATIDPKDSDDINSKIPEGTDNTITIPDTFSAEAPKQRRIFHSRVPCIISAHD